MDYPPPPSQARFSPIGLSRTPTPMPPSILKNGEGGVGRPPSNTKRQRSASFKSMLVEECDENRTVATVPENVSDTASEASSSSNNQPPLLDFMGSMCVASAWFTTCFPCAVVDINDTDDRVVHNLSRESAMNFMYSNNSDRFFGSQSPRRVKPECIPDSDGKQIVKINGNCAPMERVSNTMTPIQQFPERAKSEPKLLCIPSIIEEDESNDDEMMDVVSLDSGTAKMNMLAEDLHERRLNSHNRGNTANAPYSENLPSPQPKKKRFGMKNPFGRKKS